MAQKTYCIYHQENIDDDQQIAVEIGKGYIALVRGRKNKVAGFEYYQQEDNSLEELLGYIGSHSDLLHKTYTETRLFYNFPESLLIPAAMFNTATASDCIDLIFGKDPSARINVENVNVRPAIVNVYRSGEGWQEQVNAHFRAVTKRHLYSQLAEASGNVTIDARFYKNEMLVSIHDRGVLQLVKNFVYTSDEDILYHLLNACRQLDIDAGKAGISVSGFIGDDAPAIKMLGKYFGEIKPFVPSKDVLPAEALSGYPSHYFTSFFNLLS